MSVISPQVSKAVSNLMFYVTFSANFFLYCLSGDRFRATLRGVLRRWFCCDVEDAGLLMTTTSRGKSITETHHHHQQQQQHVCCFVAQWLGRWIRDREVASSTPGGCVSE